jgi:predicted CopG family antitoxin
MGMYSLIEDDFYRRLEELKAKGVAEDEAYEQLREEDERNNRD